jgi:hypothetical protein
MSGPLKARFHKAPGIEKSFGCRRSLLFLVEGRRTCRAQRGKSDRLRKVPAVFAQGGIPRRGPCAQNPITRLLAHKVSHLFFHLARPGVAEAQITYLAVCQPLVPHAKNHQESIIEHQTNRSRCAELECAALSYGGSVLPPSPLRPSSLSVFVFAKYPGRPVG